ncbi:MAG: tyrosine-type recombinase/integrase [Pseudomonadota bacterium]
MPRPGKGPRLYLMPAKYVGETLRRRATWVIQDGGYRLSTGCGEADRRGAENALAEYIIEKHEPPRARARHPDAIAIADIVNLWLQQVITGKPNTGDYARRAANLLAFFGTDTLADINGDRCRDYARTRTAAAARRELEDLRAAINHHHKEGYTDSVVRVVVPPRPAARERWLTRSEAAKIIWSAWRYREKQGGPKAGQATRKHIARFLLVALKTGTRTSAILGTSFKQIEGRGFVDLDRGVFHRRALGAVETKKRQPPVPVDTALLAHMRRWRANGQTHLIEYQGRSISEIKGALRRAVKDAKLDASKGPVTPHTMRHTAITWAMQNANPEEATAWNIAGYFGLTLEELERTYAHHNPSHFAGTIAAINRRPANKSTELGLQKGYKNSGTKRKYPQV